MPAPRITSCTGRTVTSSSRIWDLYLSLNAASHLCLLVFCHTIAAYCGFNAAGPLPRLFSLSLLQYNTAAPLDFAITPFLLRRARRAIACGSAHTYIPAPFYLLCLSLPARLCHLTRTSPSHHLPPAPSSGFGCRFTHTHYLHYSFHLRARLDFSPCLPAFGCPHGSTLPAAPPLHLLVPLSLAASLHSSLSMRIPPLSLCLSLLYLVHGCLPAHTCVYLPELAVQGRFSLFFFFSRASPLCTSLRTLLRRSFLCLSQDCMVVCTLFTGTFARLSLLSLTHFSCLHCLNLSSSSLHLHSSWACHTRSSLSQLSPHTISLFHALHGRPPRSLCLGFFSSLFAHADSSSHTPLFPALRLPFSLSIELSLLLSLYFGCLTTAFLPLYRISFLCTLSRTGILHLPLSGGILWIISHSCMILSLFIPYTLLLLSLLSSLPPLHLSPLQLVCTRYITHTHLSIFFFTPGAFLWVVCSSLTAHFFYTISPLDFILPFPPLCTSSSHKTRASLLCDFAPHTAYTSLHTHCTHYCDMHITPRLSHTPLHLDLQASCSLSSHTCMRISLHSAHISAHRHALILSLCSLHGIPLSHTFCCTCDSLSLVLECTLPLHFGIYTPHIPLSFCHTFLSSPLPHPLLHLYHLSHVCTTHFLRASLPLLLHTVGLSVLFSLLSI